jgi:hypothetical protein
LRVGERWRKSRRAVENGDMRGKHSRLAFLDVHIVFTARQGEKLVVKLRHVE